MATDSTRSRILNSAGPIFADRGFQATTVREICDTAGVNLAAVNYYFGDKEKLYIETVKLARTNRVDEAPLPQWSEDTPTETKLRDFIRMITTRMLGLEAAPWQVRLMMREVLQPTAACKQLVQEHFRPHFELLLGILDEVLPSDTPLHRRHQIGFSIIGQCLYYRVAGQVVALMVDEGEFRGHYTIDQLADHVAQMALSSLGLSPPLGSPQKRTQSKMRTTR